MSSNKNDDYNSLTRSVVFTNGDIKISTSVVISVIFITSFLCYVNTLNAGFVYDDQRAILTNKDLHGNISWSNLLYNDFWGTPLKHSGSHKSYRPLCVATFRLNFLFGELHPWGYHFVNNILHAVTSCLFAYVSKIFFMKQWAMLLGGIMFATHPIHTEAVAGLVGRADLGAAIFFLTSFLSYVKATRNENSTETCWLMGCMLNALLALYTKEQGITVLGVCMVYEVLFVSKCNLSNISTSMRKLTTTGGMFRLITLLLYAIFLIYSRLQVMGHSPPTFSPFDNPAASHPDATTRFLTFVYLPVCNLWLLFYPFHLSYDWSSLKTLRLVESTAQYENLLTLLLYSTLIFIAYKYITFSRKNAELFDTDHSDTADESATKRGHRCIKSSLLTEVFFQHNAFNVMIFSIACMIIPFLPATNLLFYVGFVIAERILYIPSFGFCLLVINGINVLFKYKQKCVKKIAFATTSVMILFAIKTYTRNFVWMDEEALYQSGLVTSPAKSWGNLANIYNKQNRFEEAEEAYKTALGIIPNMGDTNYNLGLLLQNHDRYDEAIEYYKKAITYRPSLAAAHMGLGVTLQKVGKKQEALEVLKKASNISDHGLKDPHAHQTSLTHIRDHLGRILYELGRNEDAIVVFMDALRRMPFDYEPVSIYNMLGQCYTALNRRELAENWYLKSLNAKADHVPALLTYAKHLSKENVQKSEKLLKKALTLEPNRTETLLIYSSLLKDQTRLAEALELLQRAYQVNSKDTSVLSQLSAYYRETKDYNKAKEFQLLLKELKPNDVTIRTNLGALYHRLGEMDEALKEYNAALLLDPHDQILLDNMKRLKRAMSSKRN